MVNEVFYYLQRRAFYIYTYIYISCDSLKFVVNASFYVRRQGDGFLGGAVPELARPSRLEHVACLHCVL